MNDTHRVIVVGAGASGMAAAIAAAVSGAHVYLLEGHSKPGRKVMASGNGRCNFANADLSPEFYNDPSFVAAAMGDEPLAPILDFFSRLGLWYRSDEDGRMFPQSRAASSVLDVLLSAIREYGVDLRLDTKVVCLGRTPNEDASVYVETESGDRIFAEAVVWAGGGSSADVPARCLSLPVVPERPALCPLSCSPKPPKSLDGVRVNCAVELWDKRSLVTRQEGEVLFRPYGVSGIVIFDLSRLSQAGDRLVLDLVSDISYEQLVNLLDQRLLVQKDRCMTPSGRLGFLDGALHPKLARHLMERCVGSNGERPIDVETLARLLKGWSFDVSGAADETHAQVTQGGIDLRCVDPSTMALDRNPGFYACGESLDVDGACGGYNLSWAWSSGMIAGVSAARCALNV